jgi:hypothetical protein
MYRFMRVFRKGWFMGIFRGLEPLTKGTHGGVQFPLASAEGAKLRAGVWGLSKFKCLYALSWHLGIDFHVFPIVAKSRVFFWGKLGFCAMKEGLIRPSWSDETRLNTCQIQAEGNLYVFLATGGQTLKIALFYKKGPFGRENFVMEQKYSDRIPENNYRKMPGYL